MSLVFEYVVLAGISAGGNQVTTNCSATSYEPGDIAAGAISMQYAVIALSTDSDTPLGSGWMAIQ